METTNRPATPLPFAIERSAGTIEIVNEETLFTICRNSTGMKGPARELAEQNMAYLVHAANAYPKLVETLSNLSAIVGNASASPIVLAYRNSADALLREFGEG